MEFVVWDLQLGNVSLVAFVWELVFDNLSPGVFPVEVSLGYSELERSLGNFRWRTST